jgi:hypothetical protein
MQIKLVARPMKSTSNKASSAAGGVTEIPLYFYRTERREMWYLFSLRTGWRRLRF